MAKLGGAVGWRDMADSREEMRLNISKWTKVWNSRTCSYWNPWIETTSMLTYQRGNMFVFFDICLMNRQMDLGLWTRLTYEARSKLWYICVWKVRPTQCSDKPPQKRYLQLCILSTPEVFFAQSVHAIGEFSDTPSDTLAMPICSKRSLRWMIILW